MTDTGWIRGRRGLRSKLRNVRRRTTPLVPRGSLKLNTDVSADWARGHSVVVRGHFLDILSLQDNLTHQLHQGVTRIRFLKIKKCKLIFKKNLCACKRLDNCWLEIEINNTVRSLNQIDFILEHLMVMKVSSLKNSQKQNFEANCLDSDQFIDYVSMLQISSKLCTVRGTE